MSAEAVIALVAVAVTVVLAAVGGLVAAAISWGRSSQRLAGVEAGQSRVVDSIAGIESWLHERDAQLEQRLTRVEALVGVPDTIVRDPTPPPRELARMRTTPRPPSRHG